MFVPLRKAKELTGLCANTLRKYADNGTIKSQRIGSGQRLYDTASLLGFRTEQGANVVCYCRVDSSKSIIY